MDLLGVSLLFLRSVKTTLLASGVFAVSCGLKDQQDDSELALINGRQVSESDHPAVWSIGGCTATFVSDSVMITAGHCVRRGGSVSLRNRSSARSIRVIHHPRYRGIGLYDTAVVLFRANTVTQWVAVSTEGAAPNQGLAMAALLVVVAAG